jgi:hypothetical protein
MVHFETVSLKKVVLQAQAERPQELVKSQPVFETSSGIFSTQ